MTSGPPHHCAHEVKVVATPTRRAPDGVVKFGVSVAPGLSTVLTSDTPALVELLSRRKNDSSTCNRESGAMRYVPVEVEEEDVVVVVEYGMSEDGTAEIGAGAGLPAGGLPCVCYNI